MNKNNKYKRMFRPKRDVHDKILILCGGETEKIYFEFYKKMYQEYFKRIEVELKEESDSPLKMVKSAIKKEGYHEIWVIFDKDDFDCFDEAISLAEKNNKIYCAFSNEAFEYWFVLHFQNTPAYIHRKQLNKMVGTHLGISNYSKMKKDAEKAATTFLKTRSILEEAEKRAELFHEQHKRDYWYRKTNKASEWKSCTTIYQLTKRLREGKKI